MYQDLAAREAYNHSREYLLLFTSTETMNRYIKQLY